MPETGLKRQHYIFVALGALAAWVAVVLAAPGWCDFIAYYATGKQVLGAPHSLYSLAAQSAAQKSFGGGLIPWAHPAPEAFLFAPLTPLSFHHAFAVWAAVSIGLFALCGWLLRDEIATLAPGGRFVLLLFCGFPISYGLLLGQDHALFLLLWVLAYRRWKAGDQFAAGLWIGLSLIRYQFAVPMLLFFIVIKAWKLLKGVAVTGCALLIASFLIVGRDLVPSYLRLLRALALLSDKGGIYAQPSIRGLAGLLLPSHFEAVAAVCTVCLLGWALTKVRGMNQQDAFCFAMMVSLLVDPHAYPYEMTILSIPVLLFLKKCPGSAMPAFIVCALTLALDVAHKELFSLLCPVLLVWPIWMSRVYGRASLPAIAGSGLSDFLPLAAGGLHDGPLPTRNIAAPKTEPPIEPSGDSADLLGQP